MRGSQLVALMLFLAGVMSVSVGAFLVVAGLTHQQIYSGGANNLWVSPSGWSPSHVSVFVGSGVGAILAGLISSGCGLIAYARRPR
jgi:hypothetical protein